MSTRTKFTTARLYWLPNGQADGHIDFGNVLDYKDAPKRQRLEHMASRKGLRGVDLSLVKSNGQLKTFTLDEEFAQTLLLLALGTQHANLVQNDPTADETGETSDDTQDEADEAPQTVLPAVVAGRSYYLGFQNVAIVSIVDHNNAALVLGSHYLLDAAAGMLTVLVANPAPWTITFNTIQVTDLVFSAYDNLFTNGTFKFIEFDQFDEAPYATETFAGQCYITAWGDNNGDKFNEFTLEVLITP